ncbi:MAG: hypothetical protein B6I36_05260 [Desulfobacteraceae bacterium 4572_35.1]|nr:MAG: hypothetical protein B6I36_05260 [Desulfobacteraceae bacterium 4572_35.1]
MKRFFYVLLCLTLLTVVPVSVFAATADNYDDLSRIYDHHIITQPTGGSVEINEQYVSWTVENGVVTYTVEPEGGGQSVDVGTTAEGDKDGAIRLLAPYLGVVLATVGGVGSGDEASAYTSPAGVTSRLVMQNLVIPAAKTRAEMKKEDAQKALNMPRTFGAALSWEDVDFDNSGENGDLYGATVGMAWDNENISYGFMLPYDYLDFDSFDAHRVGLIGFGQYNLELSDTLSTSFTGHLNYTYTDMDFDNSGSDDVNMFGGGLSAAITLDKDLFIISTGVSYLYNTDDSNVDNDEQHLVKWGVNAGVRNGDNGVFNVFAVWNSDITDYDNDPDVDEDYYEFGMEGSFTLSDAFGMTIGYKKVIELQDFDSDQVYIGSTWKF